MEKAKIGVIGLGLIGKPHSENLKKIGECDLVAVADADVKQRKLAETLGRILSRLSRDDRARNWTSGHRCAQRFACAVGIACAKKKIHLLVEKRSRRVSRMPTAHRGCKRKHVRILVGHQRNSILVEKARSIIRGVSLENWGSDTRWASINLRLL